MPLQVGQTRFDIVVEFASSPASIKTGSQNTTVRNKQDALNTERRPLQRGQIVQSISKYITPWLICQMKKGGRSKASAPFPL